MQTDHCLHTRWLWREPRTKFCICVPCDKQLIHKCSTQVALIATLQDLQCFITQLIAHSYGLTWAPSEFLRWSPNSCDENLKICEVRRWLRLRMVIVVSPVLTEMVASYARRDTSTLPSQCVWGQGKTFTKNLLSYLVAPSSEKSVTVCTVTEYCWYYVKIVSKSFRSRLRYFQAFQIFTKTNKQNPLKRIQFNVSSW